MNKDKLKTRAINAFCASMLAVTLPTPPPGEFADTESSVSVPIEDVADRIRRLVLSFPANTSPTSCVQVAVGADLNHDECLEPEETQVIFGYDCLCPQGCVCNGGTNACYCSCFACTNGVGAVTNRYCTGDAP